MTSDRRLKSPWKSPRKPDGLTVQRPAPYGPLAPRPSSSNIMCTPVKEAERDEDMPMLSQSLSGFSITRTSKFADLAQTDAPPAPDFGEAHRPGTIEPSCSSPGQPSAHAHLSGMTGLPRSQTTPPRFAPTLASPFKSGGVAPKAHGPALAKNQRLRSRAGTDAHPSAPWFGGASPRGARMEDASLRTEDSPSSGGRTRVQSWARGVVPPSEGRQFIRGDGSPTSPVARLAPRGYFDVGARGLPPSPLAPRSISAQDVKMADGDSLTQPAPPRRSLDNPLDRPARPVFKHRKSAPHQRRPENLRDGRPSPGSGHLDDIFLDSIASSASGSSGSSASSPIADKVPPMRPRLMTRRTTAGETSGWTLGQRAAQAQASSGVLFAAPGGEVALQAEQDDLTSPLGVKFGHGYIDHEPMAPDTSPILLTRKRPSPVVDDNPPTRRRAGDDSPPRALAAPRPTMFRRITAPAHVNAPPAPWRGISTPDSSAQPLPAFVAERPSPLAFVSSGLSKKGTPGSLSQRSSISSGISGMIGLGAPSQRVPSALSASCITAESQRETPIRPTGSVESLRRLCKPSAIDTAAPALISTAVHAPLLLPTITPTEVEFPPISIPASRSLSTTRGLRRKRSAMWTRTQSGNFSAGSWYGGSDGFEPEPTTPTRDQDAAATKPADLPTCTPSPAAATQSYPFADGKPAVDSPSPPNRRFSIFSRLKPHNRAQRPLARASNPLLSLAYKLGAEQAARKSEASSAVHTYAPDKQDKPAGRFEKDFVVLQPIGKGEFSIVWKVREKRGGGIYAVKRGKRFAGTRDRARQWQEVEILRVLQSAPHPHVVDFYDAWEQNAQLHIRTAFAECGDLATFLLSIADADGLDVVRCWKSLAEISAGLTHLHQLGIMHLDIKPSNILITKDGSLRISDFGLSIRVGQNHTPSRALEATNSCGSIVEGDREYLSPDVLAGHTTKAADAFSLGITMLEIFMNITLPSNGDAWQKLRSDDFTDLEEHFLPPSKTPQSATFAAAHSLGTSYSSTMTLNHGTYGSQADSPLLDLIKRLMRADPMQRATLDTVWAHPVVRRIVDMSPTLADNRMSMEAPSDASAEEWSAWERQQPSFNMDTSPNRTKVEMPGAPTLGGRIAQPALVVESDVDFWADVVSL